MTYKAENRFDSVLIGGALLAAAMMLIFRNAAVNPIPAGDEFQYSMMSRHLPYAQAWIPNYIYYLVYSSTNWCGAQFYPCVKVINAVLYVSTAFVVFLTARTIAGWTTSFLLMVAFLISPLNVYTSLFEPETMYALAAWCLAFFFIARGSDWGIGSSVLAGAGIAVLCMIKPHGMFLGFIYLAALFFELRSRPDVGRTELALNILVFVTSALLLRLAVGFLFAGSSGLNILGSAYSSVANRNGFWDHLHFLVISATPILKHVLAMTLLAGVPLCILLVRAFRAAQDGPCRRLYSYTAIFFVVMILVTSAFTATVAGSAPSETLNRLHTRYYNFYVFLFFLTVAAELGRDAARLPARVFAGGIVVALAVASFWYLPTRFDQGLVDNPEIHGLFLSYDWFVAFALVNIVLAGLWILNSRLACVLFLCLQMPLGLALSAKLLNRDLRGMAEYHNLYPKAGDLARVIWGNPIPDYFVAGTGVGEGYHTLFHVDKDGARVELAPNESLHKDKIPRGIVNGIVIGRHEIDVPHVVVYADGLIKIIKITHPNAVAN
jgi:phosphoglycerol transferase